MAELILNRFKIEISNINDKRILSFFLESDLNEEEKTYLVRYKPTKILEWNFLRNNIRNWLQKFKRNNIKDEQFVYISFFKPSEKKIKMSISELPKNLQRKYLIEEFIQSLRKDYIIEPKREGIDLSVYKKYEEVKEYVRYLRFDIVFNIFIDKIGQKLYNTTIAVGSTDTYIVNPSGFDIIKTKIKNNNWKYLKDNLLIKNNQLSPNLNYPIKANKEIRKLLNINTNPKRIFYKEYYNLIESFTKEISEKVNNIKIHSNFIRVSKINIVSFEKNKMVFRNGAEDYAAVNGMRDYGPYLLPKDFKNIQLLFIYPDEASANKLYEYLLRGYRYFPGLESYIGIPANVYNKKICYKNDFVSIVKKIKDELVEDRYDNLMALCIIPFSKNTAPIEDNKEYYKIKKALLEKNITSQFIYRDRIFNENFHFSLSNIAIAILAKCGGIPWKLAKPHYNQLTIGFNVFTKRDKNSQSFLGSAVFFDNEGIIKQVSGFSNNSIKEIANSLVSAISNYKSEKKENISKLVIHYYKMVNSNEIKEIQKITSENLGKNSSFAIVEINDSKTTLDLGFDLEYDSLMPQSGIYIKLKPNEYLLFNNLRYWEKPINPINQESLPVKLKIFDSDNSFDHHELISQVYEFSRMYWKSLKQKAQPVTTIYSKLIANYIAEFGGSLPDTEVTKKRVWFI